MSMRQIFPECDVCDCSFATGCKRLAADGTPVKRKYVMTKPRGRRGPYKIVVERVAKLNAAETRTILAVGELVQAAAHAHGITGPVQYTVCRSEPPSRVPAAASASGVAPLAGGQFAPHSEAFNDQ